MKAMKSPKLEIRSYFREKVGSGTIVLSKMAFKRSVCFTVDRFAVLVGTDIFQWRGLR
jgi:hypothetical protein